MINDYIRNEKNKVEEKNSKIEVTSSISRDA